MWKFRKNRTVNKETEEVVSRQVKRAMERDVRKADLSRRKRIMVKVGGNSAEITK